MAAQKKSQKKKVQPQWSGDQLLVRYLVGLILIALGVLVFLSVALPLSGAVLAGTRQLCYGLAGSLAFLLPAIPIWGGVLVILSTRVRPSLRAWGLTVPRDMNWSAMVLQKIWVPLREAPVMPENTFVTMTAEI